MRTFIKNYIDAKKRQKLEETGEEGFSLIELIIVVVIIGILAAIALPLFGQIQRTAVDGATESATKNAATTAVAQVASGEAIDIQSIEDDTSGTLTLAVTGTTASTICVSGFDTAGSQYIAAGSAFPSGPGC